MIEHTMSPQAVLCELNRICKPGAKGLIFVPGVSWQEQPYHCIVLTQRQMRHLLNRSGWELVELVDLTNTRSQPTEDAEMAIYKVQKRT